MMTNINIRVDSELKEQAQSLFNFLGLDMTTAINLFLRQSVLTDSVPFAISARPNEETIRAMVESEYLAKDKNTKRYSSFKELVQEVQQSEEI